MLEARSKLSAVTQNVIIGCIAGLMIGYNLKYFFNTIGASDFLWIMFFIIGPFIGYLSGRERQRYEELKKEKESLLRNFEGLQKKLQKSSERYKLLLEKINDLIFLTSKNGKFLLFNSATSTLTGYPSSKLKRMNIKDLNYSQNTQVTPEQYSFDKDNFIFNTVWKTKNGKPIKLNIEVKRISYKSYTLLLHVARILKKQTEKTDDELTKHLKLLHLNNIQDISSFVSSFYNRIIQPVNSTLKLLDYFKKNYPDEKDKCSGLNNKWTQSKKLLETVLKKRAREVTTTPSEWDLNEIIFQELNYLKTSMETGSFVVETSLDNTIPTVYGVGINFSLVLGLMFKATVLSLKESNDEFLVSTRFINEKNIIEIQMPDNNDFEQKLAELVYPSLNKKDTKDNSGTTIGLQVVEMFFNMLKADYDVGGYENKTIIRMRFPIHPVKSEEESKEFPELYKDDDFLL